MPRYDALPANLPPRGLARSAAAQYVGVGPTKFDAMVADGRMLRPLRIDGRIVWDIRALDHAFDVLDGGVIDRVLDNLQCERPVHNKDRVCIEPGVTNSIILSKNITEDNEVYKRRGKWRYVHTFKDRHGKTRNYFRRRGYISTTLPDDDSTPEFEAAYAAALAGHASPKPIVKKPRINEHSVEAVVGRCLESNRYLGAPAATRHQHAWILKKFRREYAAEDFPSLQRADYKRMISKIEQPHTQKAFLKGIRFLIKFLIEEEEMFKEDPTEGIKITVPKSDGYYTWQEDDIAAYRSEYPSGSRERRALELILWLGPRRGDAIRLGPGNIRNGKMHYTQRKTNLSLEPPIPPELQVELDFVPKDQLTFLVDDHGKPFVERTFQEWFREVCMAVKTLPDNARAHGIRKAACRRLAEAECSVKEIQSISGHATLTQLQKYIDKADQKKLSVSAQKKLREAFS